MSMTRRTQEIGIRMALGARPATIVFGLLKQGLKWILIGLVAGLMAALLLTRVRVHFLYQVAATDFSTFVILSLFLAGVALVACWLPARIDPMVALRYG